MANRISPLAWPLVGRDEELAEIAQAREDAARHGVVVYAAAGVGKSRLAREAQAAAERAGALVEWVQATRSAAAIPLGACAGLIPDAVRADDVLELMRRCAQALGERANGRAVVLCVDDAQRLDSVSAALVLHLALSAGAFVIATVRSGEPCPDAVESLWKDAGARRIELEHLSDDAMRTLVEAGLGGPVEQSALHWVVEHSRGNALYARELVLGALEAGTLARGDELWRLSGRPTASRTLIELVAQRLEGLSGEQRASLEVLALGEPLRLPELAALTTPDALIEAEALGLVSVGADDEVRLAHPLYGDVVRDALPSLRVRALRLRLAETLERRDPLAPADALRVACWRLDAGEAIPPPLLIEAASAANRAGDPELGGRLAELAVAAGGGLPAVLLLARALTVRQRFAEAETALAAAEPQAAGHAAAMEYLEQRMHVLHWCLHRREDARALLARAHTWSTDAEWAQQLEPLRLGFAGLAEGFAGQIDAMAEAFAQAQGDPHALRLLTPRYATGLFFAGRVKDAHALVTRSRPTVPLRDNNDTRLLGVCALIGLESGEDLAGLDAYMEQILRDALHANDHEASGIAAFGLGGAHFLRGRYRDARRWLAEAELHADRYTFGGALYIRAYQVGVGCFTGDLSATAAALDRMRATLDGREPLQTELPYVLRAEGWAALAQSRAAGAARLRRDAQALAEGMPGFAAQLAYEAMRAGAPVAEQLATLARRCDARLTAAYAAHATGRARHDGPALLQVADELAGIGALRYASDAAGDAAAAFLRDGRQDSARRAAARARELHVPDQGAEPPRIDGLDATATELTARESQLVGLARQGLSNGEIADRLVLSVRTVESHLYRAMHKLGISDRRDL